MSASLESSPILTRKNIQSVNTDEIYKKAKHTISAGNISFSSIYPIHTLDFYLGVYTRYFYYKYSHFSFDINMCRLLLNTCKIFRMFYQNLNTCYKLLKMILLRSELSSYITRNNSIEFLHNTGG